MLGQLYSYDSPSNSRSNLRLLHPKTLTFHELTVNLTLTHTSGVALPSETLHALDVPSADVYRHSTRDTRGHLRNRQHQGGDCCVTARSPLDTHAHTCTLTARSPLHTHMRTHNFIYIHSHADKLCVRTTPCTPHSRIQLHSHLQASPPPTEPPPMAFCHF